ncbi:MAG: hypothetical protein ABJ084_15590 [Halioglobus sp.]
MFIISSLGNFSSGPASRLAACSLAVLLIVAGCAAPRQLSDSQLAQLEERVTQRWALMQQRDFAAEWEYNSPAYRSVFPRSYHARRYGFSIDWELTEIEAVEYDARAAVASVVVRVMSKPTKPTSAASAAMGAFPVSIRETWVFDEGEWWFSAKPL